MGKLFGSAQNRYYHWKFRNPRYVMHHDENSNWPPFLKSILSQPTHFYPKIASCYLANKHFLSVVQKLRLRKNIFYFFWFRVDFFRREIFWIGDPTLKCWLLIGWSEAWRSKFKKTESTKEKYQKERKWKGKVKKNIREIKYQNFGRSEHYGDARINVLN